MPRVKEILGKAIGGFTPRNDINLENIPYKDLNKGDQKAALLEKRKEKMDRKRQINDEIHKVQNDDLRKKKQPTRAEKKHRKREADWDEWEQLQKEENLAKKLRKGKITQEEFDELIGDDLDLSSDWKL